MSLLGPQTLIAFTEVTKAATETPSTLAVVCLVGSLSVVAVLASGSLIYNKFFKYRLPQGELRR